MKIELINKDFFGSGPNGAVLMFADSKDTLRKWIQDGYLHLHPGQRTPMHREVCPCERYV